MIPNSLWERFIGDSGACERHFVFLFPQKKLIVGVIFMSALDDLIQEIADEDLRRRIEKEIATLKGTKKFGLVFEPQNPECTPLYDVPIKKKSLVALKAGKLDELYRVTKIVGEEISCVRISDGEEMIFNNDDLISVAQFGDAIYPYLQPLDTVCNAPDSSLWHALIEADNCHALQLLKYLYGGKVDCIYIDPPYNTGARDWKYKVACNDGAAAQACQRPFESA